MYYSFISCITGAQTCIHAIVLWLIGQQTMSGQSLGTHVTWVRPGATPQLRIAHMLLYISKVKASHPVSWFKTLKRPFCQALAHFQHPFMQSTHTFIPHAAAQLQSLPGGGDGCMPGWLIQDQGDHLSSKDQLRRAPVKGHNIMPMRILWALGQMHEIVHIYWACSFSMCTAAGFVWSKYYGVLCLYYICLSS